MPLIPHGHSIEPPARVRRILVCQLRQIGDVLLATPSLELLRKRFPEADIHVFTEKKCLPMLENNPHVARVWSVDKKELGHLGRELAYYLKVARQGFDIVIDFQQLPRCRWVTAFSRAKLRLTYPPKWYNRPWYTHWYRLTNGYSAMFKASLLEPLGIRWQGEKPRLYLDASERDWATGFMNRYGIDDQHILVSVDPTHRRRPRQWPPEHFAAVLAMALKHDPAFRFLLLCGPGEESVLQEIRDAMASHLRPELLDRAIIPDAILTLRQMAAVLERCRLHLGNCSAPRHMAVAVGTPSLVTLGATSSAWTYPGPDHADIASDMACRPCNRNTCQSPEKGLDPYVPCLRELPPDQVFQRMLDMLGI